MLVANCSTFGWNAGSFMKWDQNGINTTLWLSLRVKCTFKSKDTAKQFFTAVVIVYMPFNKAWEIWLSYNICCCQSLKIIHSNGCAVVSNCAFNLCLSDNLCCAFLYAYFSLSTSMNWLKPSAHFLCLSRLSF